MKNTKIALCRFAVGCILTFSLTNCGEINQRPHEEKPPIVQEPKQVISPTEAKTLFDNYKNRRVTLIQRYEDSINGYGKAFDVARYVSYDIDTIKQYIAFVEQQAAEAKVEVKSLRIYFANYPNSNGFQHPRQNSIMILPTTSDINGKEAGFYTTGNGDGGRKALTIRSLFSEKQDAQGMGLNTDMQPTMQASLTPNFFAGSTLFQGDQSLIMNRGTGAPPPKNQSDF